MNLSLLDEVLNEYSLVSREQDIWWKNKATRIWDEVLSKVPEIIKSHKLKNKKESCDFNAFMFFKINEPLHSKLLAHLLNPNESHGQGRLFLDAFLIEAKVTEPTSGDWTITAEEGRIDVLLRRENPHSVVVVENKSNYADDQPNQLYRYWEQEIYWPCKQRRRDSNEHLDSYKIIYLPPSLLKTPSLNSLSKPENSTRSELPEKMPLPVLQWSFNDQIKKIMESTLESLSENKRMSEYIKQYIELIGGLK